jgi:hypothetical protein
MTQRVRTAALALGSQNRAGPKEGARLSACIRRSNAPYPAGWHVNEDDAAVRCCELDAEPRRTNLATAAQHALPVNRNRAERSIVPQQVGGTVEWVLENRNARSSLCRISEGEDSPAARWAGKRSVQSLQKVTLMGGRRVVVADILTDTFDEPESNEESASGNDHGWRASASTAE